jgi:hypothetical protein
MRQPSDALMWDDERPYWMQEPTVRPRKWGFFFAGAAVMATVAGVAVAALSSPSPMAAANVATGVVPPAEPQAPIRTAAAPPIPSEVEAPVAPPQEVPVEAPAVEPAPAPEHRHLAARRLHFAPPTATGGGLVARWIRIGSRLAKHGQFREALAAFQRAAGLDVHSADAWYGMALCDFELHRDEAAARAANQAIWADPGHAMGNLLVGFLRQEAGHASEARQFYDRYLAREPNGPYADELISVLDQLPKAN